jgi:hypothetical protein
MGCDIHGLVERKVNGKWICWRTLNPVHTSRPDEHGSSFASPAALSRNYERFAALAGVRGDGPDARGLPDDATDTATHLFETEEGHTPSWLPLQEATDIFLATERYDLREFDRKYPAYYYFGVESESDGPLSDFRLVFWFDS